MAQRFGIIVHVEDAVDGFIAYRPMTFGAGGFVVYRIDTAQHLPCPGILDEQGGRTVFDKSLGQNLTNHFCAAGKTDLTGRVGDEDRDDPPLLSQTTDHVTQTGQIAFEHGVFQRGLQQLVDLSGGTTPLVGQLGLVERHIEQQEDQRADDQTRGGA